MMSWDKVKLRQSMGYAIQEVGLFPNKTIHGNIAVVPRLLGWDKKKIQERVDELLLMLQLDPGAIRDRYPTELSGGQQQRIGVARCLAADPDILLMDEPFGAIDPVNREEIQNEFIRVQAKLKKTIAFVTHDIHEAIKMGDKIAILQAGRLIQYDTPEAILISPANRYIADFLGSDRALKVLGLLRAGEAMEKGCKNIVQLSANTEDALKFSENNKFSSLIVLSQSTPVGYVHAESLKTKNTKIQDIIEPYPRLINEDDSLRDVLSYMLVNDFPYLPVIDNAGVLSGTLSCKDIQRFILDIYAHGDKGNRV